MQLNEIAIGAFVGALAAYAVKGAVDLLAQRLSAKHPRLAGAKLADAANEEIERIRRRQRKHAYAEFDTKLDAAVREISLGWTRMSLIYAARDQYQSIRRLASEPIVRAARTMCDVCNDMLANGYSELRHNQFQRAQHGFRAACSQDRNPPRGRAVHQTTDSSSDPHVKPSRLSPHD